MRHLHKLSVTAFDNRHTANSVSSYLLSIRLRSAGVDPKELCEYIHMSLRNTQRYVYDKHRGQICISTLHQCLNFINVPLSEFFKDVDTFINKKSYLALYDLETNSFIYYSKEEYESLEHDEELLKEAIKTRTRIIHKTGLSFVKGYIVTLDNTISKFPLELVKEHSYAISK